MCIRDRPWRPERPLNWLSILRDSCLSVPIIASPPAALTSSCSFAACSLNWSYRCSKVSFAFAKSSFSANSSASILVSTLLIESSVNPCSVSYTHLVKKGNSTKSTCTQSWWYVHSDKNCARVWFKTYNRPLHRRP